MPRFRKRVSPMPAGEFQARRLALGLSVEDLALLLDSSPQSIRNIEAGGQRPGRPLVRLLRLLAEGDVLARAARLADQEHRPLGRRLDEKAMTIPPRKDDDACKP